MAIITKPKAYSSHWYHTDGTAQHKIQSSDGSLRPTTLGDARKLGLLPSVTTIINVLDKPGLGRWKINQAILASLRTPRKEDETDFYYCSRVADVAYQQVDDAAELGSAIHHEIDRFLTWDHVKGPFVPDADMAPYVQPVINWMLSKGIKVQDPEKVVVNRIHGYAGTSDAPYTAAKSFGILDYKSRKTDPDKEIEPWPEQLLQIAAYFVGYWGEEKLLQPNAWGGNVFISTTEPGRVAVVLYPPQALRAAWSVFSQLCSVWRFLNQYDPRSSPDQQVPWVQPILVNVTRPGELPLNEPPEEKKPLPPPSSEVRILDLLNQAKQDNMCDGIKFLSPTVCAGFSPGRIKTIYAWWYHRETNTAKVGLFKDVTMSLHGWTNAFFAYPADLDHVNRAEGKPDPETGTNGLPVKPAPTPEAKPAPTPEVKPVTDKAKDRARLKELEAMDMGFGKFRDSTLRDAPTNYMDWLRGQLTKADNKIPSHVREYLTRPDVNRAIDRELKVKENSK